MTIGLIGRKLGMTRIFDEAGRVIPVTLIEVGPCPVLQLKTAESDRYTAVQLGYGEMPEKKAVRAALGHARKAGVKPHRVVREFRVDSVEGFSVGQVLLADVFQKGDKVDIVGVSKGRGFAGTIKRHHTARGPESHGSMYHRRPGSGGASADPSHTYKGKVMPGHLGNARTTVQNLRVVYTDKEKNLVAILGSIPGRNDGYVTIAKSRKAEQRAARKKAA